MSYWKSPQNNVTSKTLHTRGVIFVCVSLIALMWVMTDEKRNNTIQPDTRKIAVEAPLLSVDLGLENHIEAHVQQPIQKTTTLYDVIEDKVFLDQLKTPYGFSIEPFHNRLIWTSSEEATFKLARIDGAEITVITSNFEEPYLLKIDNSFGHTLFFHSEGRLIKKAFDAQLGSELESVLLDLGEQKIHGLGFDESSNILFIGDQYGQVSNAINLTDDGNIIVKNTILISPITTEE